MFKFLFLFLLATSAAAQTVQMVETINGERATGYLGLGDVSDLEYLPLKTTSDELPVSFDWRGVDGVVSPVKDQGQCGSCVSFATMGMFESALAIHADKKMWNMSEQNMLDCRTGDAFGCNGAMLTAADFTTQGVALESAYPYTARRGRCKQIPAAAKSERIIILGERGRKPTENEMKKAIIEYGPIMISVYAGGSGWSGRTGKITSCRRSRGNNHAVLAVGYDEEGFIIKNSWSAAWGDKGFTKLKYGCDGLGQEAVALIVN
jgi:C1A family cysteine protease